MRFNKRFYALLVLAAFTIQLISPCIAFASDQAVKPLIFDVSQDAGAYKIYNKLVAPYKNHVVLKWTDIGDAGFPADAVRKAYRIYTRENGQITYNPFPVTVDSAAGNLELDVDANGNEDLKSGTIYESKITAFHTHVQDDVVTTHESSLATATSTTFMTDIELEVTTAGTDSLQIKWDDVKYNNQRINYEIFIKESKDFGTAPTYTVRPQDISSAGPVIPDTANRKLTYTATGLKGGTIYYVKIKPIISGNVRYNPETVTDMGATNIIATATRLSDDWWRLDWNKITNANLAQGEPIEYSILRGDSSTTLLPTLGSTTDNKYYVEISDSTYYFIITAKVKNQLGGFTTLESDKLRGIESDVAVAPPMPELKDIILENPTDPNSSVYEYVYAVTSTQAKVAWTHPQKANGDEDIGTLYDIWLLTDPSGLSNANTAKVRSNYQIPDSAKIYGNIDRNKLLGYSYTFNNLTPNTVYYLKIVAKKLYTINVNGQLQQQYYESEAALRVIVTPTGGPIDQPSAPAKPPLRVKLTNDGKPDVNTTTINIQWENKWWEAYQNGKWEYYPESQYSSVVNSVYRHVVYDSDVRFDIGYIEYPEGQDAIDFNQIVRNNPTRINGIPNNMLSVVQEYAISNLTPNTKYIIWLKAHRQTGDLISEPSDPLVVITKPLIVEPVEKPIVPTFTLAKGGDTYVDLEWTSKAGYYYYIKYNTVDDIGSAQTAPDVTPADLQTSSIYRVKGLKPNQVYYFWIQADSTQSKADQDLSTSLWSDSIYAKTTPFIPPETPKGFGVKDGENAIGKNSIAFEWIKETGLTYILEIASDVNYSDKKEYTGISADEYTVTGLRSNFRYWVRLYAFDPAKGLRSDPTQSITVKTKRSDDDYDSDVDTDNVITGPFIEDSYSSGVWTVKIIGVNADRFVEKVKTDKVLDYKIDLTKEHSGANKRVILVSNKVFTALTELKENINIDTGFSLYTIRPHVMDSDQVNQIAGKDGNVNIEMTIVQSSMTYVTGDYSIAYQSSPSDIYVNIISGTQTTPLKSFNNPMKVAFPYSVENLFADGKISGYTYDEANIKWDKQATSTKYDKLLSSGYATFDMKAPGRAALMKKNTASSTFYDISNHPAANAINSIYSKFELPSMGSGYFRPNETLATGDALKLIMDVLDYKYGTDYAETAAKAGLISAGDISNLSNGCTKKQLYKMLDRLYEIKSGEKAAERYSNPGDSQTISRGNAMLELYYVLSDLGEL